MGDGLNQAAGHPTDGGKKFANGKFRQAKATWFCGLESVFAFSGGTTFQFMIHLVSDPACFVNRLLHRENKAWNGLVAQVIETDFFQRNRADPITTPRFAEIGMTFAGMN
jgi:hypothetical protein